MLSLLVHTCNVLQVWEFTLYACTIASVFQHKGLTVGVCQTYWPVMSPMMPLILHMNWSASLLMYKSSWDRITWLLGKPTSWGFSYHNWGCVCVCLCLCLCVSLCMYVCIHVFVCVVCVYMYVYTYVRACVCTCASVCQCMLVYTHVCIHNAYV